jgi:hypothetical protein
MTHIKNAVSPDSFESYSLQQRHLAIIRSILNKELAGPDCKVYLFGSRARKTARSASDVDLAIQSSEDMHARIARAQHAFEESDLPYTVDLVDLKHASPFLKREIQENGQLIWES